MGKVPGGAEHAPVPLGKATGSKRVGEGRGRRKGFAWGLSPLDIGPILPSVHSAVYRKPARSIQGGVREDTSVLRSALWVEGRCLVAHSHSYAIEDLRGRQLNGAHSHSASQ